MQLQIIPMPMLMPYIIHGASGGTRPNTESENLAILSVIISIYFLWIVSFLITYLKYKSDIKKGDRWYFREYNRGYLTYRNEPIHDNRPINDFRNTFFYDF